MSVYYDSKSHDKENAMCVNPIDTTNITIMPSK